MFNSCLVEMFLWPELFEQEFEESFACDFSTEMQDWCQLSLLT